jgi:hypothetical protein
MSQHSRVRSRLSIVGLMVAVAACADQLPVAPTNAGVLQPGAPAFATATVASSQGSTYPVLTRTVALPTELSTTAWIYPSKSAYQSVKIGDAGIKISFAPGAVSAPLRVTLIAHAGTLISYEFLPHGTTFGADVKIQQDLHGTNAYQNEAVMSSLVAGYLANGTSDINYTDGTATFSETFPIYYWDGTTSFKKTTPSVAKFYTRHFSGYSLASGFSGGTDLYGM